MDNARVKTFFILVLLVVNGFLLAMVLSDRAQANQAEALKRQEMVSALQERGITLSDPGILNLKIQQPRELSRNPEKEFAAMRALLGADTTFTDQGGGVYNYDGSKGTARFPSSGDFSIHFKPGEAPDQGSLLKTAHAILKELGIKTDPSYDRANETGEWVQFRCALDGRPVYKCTVKFTLIGENLEVSRTSASDTAASVSAAPQLDICTLLLRFLDNIRNTGDVCTEIRGVTQGYIMSTNLAGQSVFSPTLCVEIDGGRSIGLDCETGDFVNIQ